MGSIEVKAMENIAHLSQLFLSLLEVRLKVGEYNTENFSRAQ